MTASLLDGEPMTCLERIEAILLQFVIAFWVIGVLRDGLTERVTGKPVAPFVFYAGQTPTKWTSLQPLPPVLPRRSHHLACHTILLRTVPMSLLEKARSVCVLMLPSLATDSENAVMVSSSGASNTATRS